MDTPEGASLGFGDVAGAAGGLHPDSSSGEEEEDEAPSSSNDDSDADLAPRLHKVRITKSPVFLALFPKAAPQQQRRQRPCGAPPAQGANAREQNLVTMCQRHM